jgi:hypothetical protein
MASCGTGSSKINIQINKNSANLKKEAYRDGIKGGGDKIGVGCMRHG